MTHLHQDSITTERRTTARHPEACTNLYFLCIAFSRIVCAIPAHWCHRHASAAMVCDHCISYVPCTLNLSLALLSWSELSGPTESVRRQKSSHQESQDIQNGHLGWYEKLGSQNELLTTLYSPPYLARLTPSCTLWIHNPNYHHVTRAFAPHETWPTSYKQ